MSGPALTVPPPRDDDHDDVAWALRAASAQWRRDSAVDAIGWVRRAAETAEEIGAYDRAAELNRLANELSRGPIAVAPPPPPGARGSLVDIQVDIDEVDLDEVEELEGLEGAEEVEDVDEFDDATDVSGEDEILFDDVEPEDEDATDPDIGGHHGSIPSVGFPVSAPPPAPSSRPPAPSIRTRSSSTGSGARRPTTSSGVDLPPSMRPEPSGIDLAEEPEEEDFGELEFPDEQPTGRVSLSEAPPIPDLGGVRMDVPSQIPLERSTAAEYATSRGPSIPHDHDAIERELGVNLSLRVSGSGDADEDIFTHPAAPLPPDLSSFSGVGPAAPSFGMSRAHEPPPPSVEPPLGAYEDPFGDAVSPVPGRASVRPSQLPDVQRITSADSEPYGLAPSAQMPPAAEVVRSLTPFESLPSLESAPPPHYGQTPRISEAPRIEPPSRPSSAPPPDEMEEPDERSSTIPHVAPTGYRAAVSSAPDLDEFDNMFEALSRPPPKPSGAPQAVAPAADAPLPPGFSSANGQFEAPAPSVGAKAGAADGALSDEGAVEVDGLDLMEIQGLQDLPEDAARALSKSAQVVTLAPGEEVSSFGVALVTNGSVQLMPTVADATCAIARRGEVLFTKGTLDSEVAVRVVGAEPGSRVALFSKESLEAATSSCPWVADELAEVADKYLAFAGAVLGPLGDSLDDMFRFMVLDKCEVKSKAPGTIIATAGKAMDGMYILGGGTLEVLAADGSVAEELGMGDFVFPETVLSAGRASATVRVGGSGALVLFANRMSAHELLATCPPFIELLAG